MNNQLLWLRHPARSELGQRLGEILPAVHAAILEQSLMAADPRYLRYLDMEMVNATHDVTAGIAVDTPVADAEPVPAVVLPGGEVAALWHVGPYHKLVFIDARQNVC
jgi:hypothetical protein